MITLRRVALSGLLALVLTSALPGCGNNLTPEESIARAKAYMEKNEYRPAMIELSNAAQKAPGLMEARWLLAKAALMLQEGARAEKEIRKAMELGQTRQATQPLLVQSILLQGDLARVLKETETIPQDMSDANKAAVLGLRAHALLAQGKLEMARTILDDALRTDPNALEAQLGMTALHGVKREFDESRRWAQQAMKAHPTAPEAWSALGDLELAQNQPAKAEEAFGKAIAFRGGVSLDSVKRALVRIQLKKYGDAEKDLASLKQQGFAKHPLVSNAEGRLHFAEKRYPQAAEAFELSQTGDPDNRLNSLYLAITYHLLGQQEKAFDIANRLAGSAPNSRTVQQLLGSIQMSRDDYDAARQTLSGALAKAPNDTNVLHMLTSLSLIQGDKAKALEYASRLVSLAPDSPEARRQLMTAKLIAGQALDGNAANAAGDAYSTEFLLALDAFRNKKLADTLARVDKLHARYPDKVDPINLKAAVYLMAAQWDKAKPELEKVLKLQPNEPSATRNLAKVEMVKGNAKRARELLQTYVKSRPEDEEAALMLAEAESRLGNPAVIPALLNQTLQHNPGALAARARLAVEYLRVGKHPDVLALTKGLSDTQYQRQPALLEVRGKAFMLNGEGANARKTFEQWVKLAPNSAPAHFYLGDSLARAGDGAGARKALDRSIKLNPRYLPARIGEVKALIQANQVQAAGKAIAKLKQEFGALPDILALEGWYALGTHDFAGAEKSLAAALAKQPASELAVLLARAQLAQKKTDAAVKTLRDRLQAQPKDLAVMMHLAGLYLGLNRNEESRAEYARIVEAYPSHVPALNNLAWLSQDKDLNQAIKIARQAESLAPRDPYVKDTLGMLTLRQGDATGALRLLADAAKAAPADQQIQLHYGQTLAKQQRVAESRKVLQAMIGKAPNSPQAKEAKALLGTLDK